MKVLILLIVIVFNYSLIAGEREGGGGNLDEYRLATALDIEELTAVINGNLLKDEVIWTLSLLHRELYECKWTDRDTQSCGANGNDTVLTELKNPRSIEKLFYLFDNFKSSVDLIESLPFLVEECTDGEDSCLVIDNGQAQVKFDPNKLQEQNINLDELMGMAIHELTHILFDDFDHEEGHAYEFSNQIAEFYTFNVRRLDYRERMQSVYHLSDGGNFPHDLGYFPYRMITESFMSALVNRVRYGTMNNCTQFDLRLKLVTGLMRYHIIGISYDNFSSLFYPLNRYCIKTPEVRNVYTSVSQEIRYLIIMTEDLDSQIEPLLITNGHWWSRDVWNSFEIRGFELEAWNNPI